jgi:hypothetical protein
LARLLSAMILMSACAPARPDTDGPVHGTVLTSWQPDQYRDPSTRKTLRRLVDIGINHVSVLTTWYQSSIWDHDIAPVASRTPQDHGLLYALGEAKDLGLVTAVKPHLDLPDATWRGEIQPADEAAWFAAYTAFIVHYAELAEEADADWLVVGTELKGTERSDRWRDVFAAVREVYSGKLTYASNWDSFSAVTWWDEVDVIGVDAYFPLTSTFEPDPAALRGAWERLHGQLDTFAEAEGRPVVLTEVGYQDRDGANTSPWWAPTDRKDAEEQLHCLDAMLGTLPAGEHVGGAYLWKTFFDPARDEDGFDVIHKPAEAVVGRAWAR